MAGEQLMNLLTEAEQALASIALPPVDDVPRHARSVRWEELHGRPAATPAAGRNALRDATVTLRIELGRTHLSPDELRGLRKGSIIPLDRAAGDSANIYAGGRLAARGEVVVLDGRLGVRVVEVISGGNGN